MAGGVGPAAARARAGEEVTAGRWKPLTLEARPHHGPGPRRMPIGPGIGHEPGFLPDTLVAEDLHSLPDGIKLEWPAIAVIDEARHQCFEIKRPVPDGESIATGRRRASPRKS